MCAHECICACVRVQYDFLMADVTILIIMYLCVMTMAWEYLLQILRAAAQLTPNGTPPSISIFLGMNLSFAICIWIFPCSMCFSDVVL